MMLLGAVAIALGQPLASFAQYKAVGNVIGAAAAVLDELKERYEFLAVGFHSPACAACGPFKSAFGEVARHYAHAAPLLPFALVNCEAENSHCRLRERVSHLPLFRLFYRGQALDHRAPLGSAEMKSFVDRRIIKACLRLTDVGWSIAKLLDRGELAVLFLGDSTSADFPEFRAAAFLFEAAHFFFSPDPALHAAARRLCSKSVDESPESRLLLLDPDHRVCHYLPGRVERQRMLGFLKPHVKLGMSELNRRVMDAHAAYRQPVVVFFAREAKQHALFDEFDQASKKHKAGLLFAFVDVTASLNSDVHQVIDFLGLSSEDAPCVRAFSLVGVHGREKWRPSRDAAPGVIEDFVAEVAASKMQPYRKSETSEQLAVKNSKGGAVKSISADEFKEKILARPNLVFLLVVGGVESCPLCPQFEAAAEAVVHRLKSDKHPHVDYEITKMDAQRNEVPGWAFDARPDLILFEGGSAVSNLAHNTDVHAIYEFISRSVAHSVATLIHNEL